MSTQYKVGQVVQNIQGRFAQILDHKGSRFGLSAWVIKEADAKEEGRVVRYLNTFGLSQVLKGGDHAPKADEKAEKPKPSTKAKAADTKAPKADEKAE